MAGDEERRQLEAEVGNVPDALEQKVNEYLAGDEILQPWSVASSVMSPRMSARMSLLSVSPMGGSVVISNTNYTAGTGDSCYAVTPNSSLMMKFNVSSVEFHGCLLYTSRCV